MGIEHNREGVGRRKVMIESLAVESGQIILDLGCGGGYQVRDLALAVGSEGRVTGADPSSDQLDAAREYCSDLDNIEFVEESGTDLSFSDDTFDSVTSTNVLEYINDVDSTISEIRRVLRKGGRYCTTSVLWDHVRFHGPEPVLNNKIHKVFREHCIHQMLPLELPRKLQENGFSGISSMSLSFLNQTMHNNAFAKWFSILMAKFATSEGMPGDDVAEWQKQLEEADREGRFGFVSFPVLTTGVAV